MSGEDVLLAKRRTVTAPPLEEELIENDSLVEQ
jgi:hypothetical protein